jgi:uncharacterized protein YceK
MKKVLFLTIIIIVSVLLSACGSIETEKDMIQFKSGIYYDKNWDETVGSYTKATVTDEQTAIGIAKAIFNGMEKSAEAQKYVPQSVFFDEEDEIWIVSFWKDSDEITIGGDCGIAIQKQDGKVLRIWFGE